MRNVIRSYQYYYAEKSLGFNNWNTLDGYQFAFCWKDTKEIEVSNTSANLKPKHVFPIQIDPLLHLAEHSAPTTKMEDQNNIIR